MFVREQKLLARRQERFAERLRQRSTRSALDRAGYKGSVRCLTLAGAFGLWADYVQQADQALASVPNVLHTLRYEDFLAEPAKHLRELANFCGLLDVTDNAVLQAAAKVNQTRANAFLNNTTLAAFNQTVRGDPWMRKFGY